MELIDRLSAISDRYSEVGKSITDPTVIADMKKYPTLMREYRELEKINIVYLEYKKALDDLKGAKEILYSNESADLKEMAQEEYNELSPKIVEMEEAIKFILIPKDPEDTKNVIVEIRAGTGGRAGTRTSTCTSSTTQAKRRSNPGTPSSVGASRHTPGMRAAAARVAGWARASLVRISVESPPIAW